MRILVQKFGGTSVATPELRRRVVGHVRRARQEGYHPVVVVSAMGRAGDPYATDTLLNLVDQEEARLSPRELDLLLSCGEIISAALLAGLLAREGIPAAALTGMQAGIITDDRFGDARIVEVEPAAVVALLQEGKVPVIAGFQGRTPEGEVTTLGRGGSDTSAAALAAALGAVAVEIYTDVDGVMTADPRVVPEARSLRTLTYREVVEMAHLGAKVVHPRAVEIAMEERIPLYIRSTRSESPGTLIGGLRPGQTIPRRLAVGGRRVVTAVTQIPGLAQVLLEGEEDWNRSPAFLAVFDALAGRGISLDMIHVSSRLIAFVVDGRQADQASEVLGGLGLLPEVGRGFAKVSAIGVGMHGVPGVMARIARALRSCGIAIYQTTDSHAVISCLVREEAATAAVRALHQEFGLADGETPSPDGAPQAQERNTVGRATRALR